LAFASLCSISVDVSPFRLSGRTYGVLLNQRDELTQLGPRISQPPYNAAPVAPVLFIKPRNTLALSGDCVRIPAAETELEVGASVGVVIGRVACHVAQDEALDYAAGYLIVNDVSLPHTNYYRPSVRLKARDGFCPLGPAVTPSRCIPDPAALSLRTFVDGVLVQTSSTSTLVRPIGRLLADVTEFMTLAPGDVFIVGVAAARPRVRSGQTVRIECGGLATLSNVFTSESA
jgi:5-oxopent-3-ene-1,2,5-tricarboxylate decarboxylase/2-hydroxyhepta-2,4-diene-1,7-dioate isomerase